MRCLTAVRSADDRWRISLARRYCDRSINRNMTVLNTPKILIFFSSLKGKISLDLCIVSEVNPLLKTNCYQNPIMDIPSHTKGKSQGFINTSMCDSETIIFIFRL